MLLSNRQLGDKRPAPGSHLCSKEDGLYSLPVVLTSPPVSLIHLGSRDWWMVLLGSPEVYLPLQPSCGEDCGLVRLVSHVQLLLGGYPVSEGHSVEGSERSL